NTASAVPGHRESCDGDDVRALEESGFADPGNLFELSSGDSQVVWKPREGISRRPPFSALKTEFEVLPLDPSRRKSHAIFAPTCCLVRLFNPVYVFRLTLTSSQAYKTEI